MRATFVTAIHMAIFAQAKDCRRVDRNSHWPGQQRDEFGPIWQGAGAVLVGP